MSVETYSIVVVCIMGFCVILSAYIIRCLLNRIREVEKTLSVTIREYKMLQATIEGNDKGARLLAYSAGARGITNTEPVEEEKKEEPPGASFIQHG